MKDPSRIDAPSREDFRQRHAEARFARHGHGSRILKGISHVCKLDPGRYESDLICVFLLAAAVNVCRMLAQPLGQLSAQAIIRCQLNPEDSPGSEDDVACELFTLRTYK